MIRGLRTVTTAILTASSAGGVPVKLTGPK
jgi:hypothetical protein